MNTFLQVVIIVIVTSTILSGILILIWVRMNRNMSVLVSSNEKRRYLLYVPRIYDHEKSSPLVIALHGFGQWPNHHAQLTQWNELAEKSGFIVVYPSGSRFPKRWRAYHSPGNENKSNKDIVFIKDLIESLERSYNIDRNRIFINGFSNGGGLTMILSCLQPEKIAAVGTVAGVFLSTMEECHPSRSVPMILFHGTDDPIVPYKGGMVRSSGYNFPNIPELVGTIAVKNGFNTPPEQIQLSENVDGRIYSNSDSEIALYTITGGGHAWPGGGPLPKKLVGFINREVNATQMMWDFFQKHPYNR